MYRAKFQIISFYQINICGFICEKKTGRRILKFAVLRKNTINSPGSPSLCKYFPNIFLSTGSSKIFAAVQFVPSLFHILHQVCWNYHWFLWTLYCCWDGFQLVPNYQIMKLISIFSVWNILIAKKWKPRYVFLNFLFPKRLLTHCAVSKIYVQLKLCTHAQPKSKGIWKHI